MVDQDDGAKLESRPPSLNDLLRLCRELNIQDAKYIVIGGMAMIQAGFVRATEDIDLLIESSTENQERVRKALMSLPDKAVRSVQPQDLDKYTVVKVADEFVVDLMKSACGIDYQHAENLCETVIIEGVNIPFANPRLLWNLKQTHREKDELDLVFLRELLKKHP